MDNFGSVGDGMLLMTQGIDVSKYEKVAVSFTIQIDFLTQQTEIIFKVLDSSGLATVPVNGQRNPVAVALVDDLIKEDNLDDQHVKQWKTVSLQVDVKGKKQITLSWLPPGYTETEVNVPGRVFRCRVRRAGARVSVSLRVCVCVCRAPPRATGPAR